MRVNRLVSVHLMHITASQVCNVPSFHEMGTTFYPDENHLGGPWPTAVPCEDGDTGPGSIGVEALTKLVDFFSGKGHPIIIVFNYGSTFKGAYDDVKSAQESVLPVLKKNRMYKRKIFHPELKEVIIRKGSMELFPVLTCLSLRWATDKG